MDDSIYYDGGYIAFMLGIMGFALVFAVIFYIIGSIFLMKIFEKAGVQGKWRAWVPVYNSMIFLKLGDMSPWLILYAIGASVLLGWIPVLGQIVALAAGVLMVIAAWRVGLKLQKEAVWVVLYIFLSLVWMGIAAFDKSRWNPNIAPAPWANNAFFADRTQWEGIPVQPSAQPQAGGAYGAAQGYAPAPEGYQPPAPQGYAPPAQPGYAPPAQPGYAPPSAPETGAGVPPVPPIPPVPPVTPPSAPPAPPAPPTPPSTEPEKPADPNTPPA